MSTTRGLRPTQHTSAPSSAPASAATPAPPSAPPSAPAPAAPDAAGHLGGPPPAGPAAGTQPGGSGDPTATAREAHGTPASEAGPGSAPASDGRARRAAIAGGVLLGLLVVLGLLVRTGAVDRMDLRIDRAVQPLRTAGATDMFRWLTDASAEAVGIGALVVGVVVLAARGRRFAAARLLVTAGAAWSLALVLKAAVDRPRPPASLWVQPPDNSGSFPSGHDTTATLLLVIVVSVLVGTGKARRWVGAVAALFALAVGFGRVYLGDHYPTDILGSYLTVAAVVLLVLAVTDLPPVRRRLAAIGIRDGSTPMSWRGRTSDAACPCPAAPGTPATESVQASARPHGHPRGTASTTGRADTHSPAPDPDEDPGSRPAADRRRPRG